MVLNVIKLRIDFIAARVYNMRWIIYYIVDINIVLISGILIVLCESCRKTQNFLVGKCRFG